MQLVSATVAVDGMVLPAEDKTMMTSSTDEVVNDVDQHIPMWIGKTMAFANYTDKVSIKMK